MAIANELLLEIKDDNLRDRLKNEIDNLSKNKKFGLVYEEHIPECTQLPELSIKVGSKVIVKNADESKIYKVFEINDSCVKCMDGENTIYTFDKNVLISVAEFGDPIYPYLIKQDSISNGNPNSVWNTLIQADNYHALQLLEYLYAGKVDCIYIDPPYNKVESTDWKYNCNYVDKSDYYRHSKWLSMIEKRLKIAKKLLNPQNSVLIVTIDEEEYLHLGCLLEETFPEARIQMVTDIINPRGTNRDTQFSRVEEYIYICQFGESQVFRTDNNMLGNTDETAKSRVWFGFNRGNNPRSSANAQFFPIYIDPVTKKIIEVGESMPYGASINEFPMRDGLVSAFPINKRGTESIWRAIPETTREWIRKGYVRVSKYDSKVGRWTLKYIPSGLQGKIESGEIEVSSKREDGSLDIERVSSSEKNVNPRTVWLQKIHNATDYGASIIKELIPNHDFSYPKSLYSEHDTLRFFVGDKPNALIVDFFAGSGTTLHAVNLLNKEDGGKRQCIIVTNNEIGPKNEKEMKNKGYKPGDDEWEKIGIARYITWPRTVASITGKDINGKLLTNKYFTYLTKDVEINRKITQISYLENDSLQNLKDRKAIANMISNGDIPSKAISLEMGYTIPGEDNSKSTILFDDSKAEEWLEELSDYEDIENYYIITKDKKTFNRISKQIKEEFGKILVKKPVEIPMSEGFNSNCIFFKLGFLDKNEIAIGKQFKSLLPLLWLKSGAIGECPSIIDDNPDMLIFPNNNFAVLNNENKFYEFKNKLLNYSSIENVFFVTNYEPSFISMSSDVNIKNTYQLYKDYLDNFRINIRRAKR